MKTWIPSCAASAQTNLISGAKKAQRSSQLVATSQYIITWSWRSHSFIMHSHLCIFVPQQSVDLVLLSLSLETRNPNVHYFQFEERNFQKMSFNLCRFKFFVFCRFLFFVLCFVWKFGSASRNFKRFKTFVPVAAFVLDGVQPT